MNRVTNAYVVWILRLENGLNSLSDISMKVYYRLNTKPLISKIH